MSDYTLTVRTDRSPAAAEQAVREALAEEGFGVLTEIDVQATLKDKLDHDMAPYRILGACNPSLARQALELDYDIGGLLPCNVVVRAIDGGSEVVAADPGAMLAIAGDELADVAGEARERVQRALAAVADGQG